MFEKVKQIFTSIFSKEEKVDIVDPVFVADDVETSKKEVVFNPLEPYYEDVSISSYMEEVYRNQGRPFTDNDYKFIFKEYISIKNFLNEDKTNYLKKIWEDAAYVNNALSILNKLDISYTLDLTGGSVRDFVLNNHQKIKDLDFMVSLQKEFIPYEEIEFSSFFSKEELVKVNWSRCDNNALAKSKLVQLCFNRLEEDLVVFEHSDERKIAYAKDKYGADLFRTDRLISVIKLDGRKTHYPVDILLTDFAKPEFLSDFDFDICKASFCFVNPHVNKKFPKNYSHLISRFVGKQSFWADAFNNTCTYNTQDRSINQIHRSFEDHLPRIQKKYPHFKIVVIGDEDKKTYANNLFAKLELVKQMEKDLNRKENLPKNTIKKVKI